MIRSLYLLFLFTLPSVQAFPAFVTDGSNAHRVQPCLIDRARPATCVIGARRYEVPLRSFIRDVQPIGTRTYILVNPRTARRV